MQLIANSSHHVDTTEGDTFGGMGTSKEVREEELLDRVHGIIILPDQVHYTDLPKRDQ